MLILGGHIKYIIRSLIIISFLAIFASSAQAQEFKPEYYTQRLDNGAIIVCRHMPESSLVTVQIRVLSGLSNEGKYAGTGISHYLEHLLFKGTKNRTSEDLRKEIKRLGGMTNGSTGLDSAEYHITAPKESFKEILSLISDMVMELVFTDEEFEKEREVILREINMRNDDPISRRIKLLFSKAYTKNVYKYPIIGNEKEFKQLTRKDVEAYHNAVYVPNRVVIGVAGGVPPDEVLKEAEDKFKKYKRNDTWKTDVVKEPVQEEARIFTQSADVTLGYFAIGFHSTDLMSPDLYTGDVMSLILGEGYDSHLYKRLVKEKELLYSVSSGNETPRYPGLFIITGIGEQSKLEEARKEIFNVIEELKKKNVTSPEISRAKNIVLSQYLHVAETITGTVSTMTIARILTGEVDFLEKYVTKIREVKENGVEDFLSKYLREENSTTVYLVPEDYYDERIPLDIEEDIQYSSGENKVELHEETQEQNVLKNDQEDTYQKVSSEKAPAEDVPAVKYELDNGLSVIIKKKGIVPLVSVVFAVQGGLRSETEQNNGISNLTSFLVLRGTKNRDAGRIMPVLEGLGGSIHSFSGMNSAGVVMDILSDNLDEGMNVFEDVLKNAVFPEDEITRIKKKIIAAIKEDEKDIFNNGIILLRRILYGEHPYSMRVQGAVDTVENITRDDMLKYYHEHYVPENAVLTIVGDVDPEKVIKDIERRFGEWEGNSADIPFRKIPEITGIIEENITMDKEQALLLIGFRGVKVTNEKKYALAIISSILSGSDGLLFYELREKEGLTYASGAVSMPEVDPGYFVIYAATEEGDLEKARDITENVLRSLTSGGITDDEVEEVKNQLVAGFAYSCEINALLSMKMVLDELYGLGFDDYKEFSDKIYAVSKQEIVDCAEEMLDPDKCAIVIVHSEE